jgi:hypothetical protein
MDMLRGYRKNTLFLIITPLADIFGAADRGDIRAPGRNHADDGLFVTISL